GHGLCEIVVAGDIAGVIVDSVHFRRLAVEDAEGMGLGQRWRNQCADMPAATDHEYTHRAAPFVLVNSSNDSIGATPPPSAFGSHLPRQCKGGQLPLRLLSAATSPASAREGNSPSVCLRQPPRPMFKGGQLPLRQSATA